jgi:hypothetical protein
LHGEQTARPDADCTGIDDEGGKKYTLANAIDSLGDELASIVVSSLTKMFSQYWSHSMVFIDPSCDIDAGADTAAAFLPIFAVDLKSTVSIHSVSWCGCKTITRRRRGPSRTTAERTCSGTTTRSTKRGSWRCSHMRRKLSCACSRRL